MTSLAAVMSKPDSRGTPCGRPPRPMTMCRKRPVVHVQGPLPEDAGRVEVEVAEVQPVVDRRGEQVVRRGDRVEVAGELEVDRVRRLDAAGSRRRSPRPCGRRPAPSTAAAAPGPRSCRSGCRPWASPIDVVVLPSPAGVGVIAETRISLPGGRGPRPGAGPRAAPWPCRGRRARGARRRSPGRRATSAIGLSPVPSCCDMLGVMRIRFLELVGRLVAGSSCARRGRNSGRSGSRSPGSTARSRGSAARRSARPARPAGKRPARDDQVFDQG